MEFSDGKILIKMKELRKIGSLIEKTKEAL